MSRLAELRAQGRRAGLKVKALEHLAALQALIAADPQLARDPDLDRETRSLLRTSLKAQGKTMLARML